jgi:hypothetical protein
MLCLRILPAPLFQAHSAKLPCSFSPALACRQLGSFGLFRCDHAAPFWEAARERRRAVTNSDSHQREGSTASGDDRKEDEFPEESPTPWHRSDEPGCKAMGPTRDKSRTESAYGPHRHPSPLQGPPSQFGPFCLLAALLTDKVGHSTLRGCWTWTSMCLCKFLSCGFSIPANAAELLIVVAKSPFIINIL